MRDGSVILFTEQLAVIHVSFAMSQFPDIYCYFTVHPYSFPILSLESSTNMTVDSVIVDIDVDVELGSYCVLSQDHPLAVTIGGGGGGGYNLHIIHRSSFYLLPLEI